MYKRVKIMTDDNSENNLKGSKEKDPSNKTVKETAKIEQTKNEPAKKEPVKKESHPKSDTKIEKPIKEKSKTTTKKENLFNAKPAPKMEASKNKKISWLSIVSFILIVLLFSVSAWMFYQQQQTKQSLQTIEDKIKNDLQAQSVKVNRVLETNNASVNEINQLKMGLQSLAKHNNDLKLQLLSVQEKIKSLSGRRKQDWMLAEVEYFINIAELKLTLQKDRNTAIQLLKTADERIIEIADQSLVPIREAIARDISVLSLIQESDITGIVITLNTLDQQIGKLELLAFKFDEVLESNNSLIQTEEENEKSEQDESTLADLSKIYKRFVKEFIVIKDHTETPQPLMTPQQRGNLNRNIQLVLQQAQIAAMQGNEKLYRLNLQKAIKWIVQYFGQGAETVPIIKRLEELLSEKIDVRYPTQLESSKAIEEANKNQLYNWLDNSLNPTNLQKTSHIDKTSQEQVLESKEDNKQ
ncbi:MAG: hypothetical protein COB38_08370 [Gammaproteobacteria bacterium]|nr:MAG: hypothetical protein COB38_08370 [Gammaproteobacteria bacterium]